MIKVHSFPRVSGAWTISLVFTLICSATKCLAGECVQSVAEDIATLKGELTSNADSHKFTYSLSCLSSSPHFMGTRWAGPIGGSEIAHYRNHPLRPDVEAIAIQLLHSSFSEDPFHHWEIAALAARFGIAKIDTLDVYQALISRPDHQVYELLAFLGDSRAVDFLGRRYREVRGHWTYQETRWELEELLCCLYHTPGREALALAEQLLQEESDSELRQRITRVVQRPS